MKKLSVGEHLEELRRRLGIVLISVLVGAGIGYWQKDWLLRVITQPVGQPLIYTSPAGGFSFVMKICIYFGLITAIPVAIYQVWRFVEPVSDKLKHVKLRWILLVGLGLVGCGLGFWYWVALPTALNFLAQFGSGQTVALISTEEYLNFAIRYALMLSGLFELPLIMWLVNKVYPLNFKLLVGAQKYVIVVSLIAAAVITPSGDVVNLFLLAGPAIALYYVAWIGIGITNRTG